MTLDEYSLTQHRAYRWMLRDIPTNVIGKEVEEDPETHTSETLKARGSR